MSLLRQSDYEATFKALAAAHKRIQHTDAAPRFARIVVSPDPYQRSVDLQDMAKLLGKALKPGPGGQVLVIESLFTRYDENGGDNTKRVRHAAFYVLQKIATAGDLQAAGDVISQTEETGEQLYGKLQRDLADQVKVRLVPGSLTNDPVGPLASGLWYGTRFDFDFTTPGNAALAYHPDAFLP